MIKIATTGHRMDGFGGEGAIHALTRFAISLVKRSVAKHKHVLWITGMAMGWDLSIAYACAHEGVLFDAYVPCRDQDKLWPSKWREYYAELLHKAHCVNMISMQDYSHGVMQKRNQRMVDDCEILAAMWSGKPGGTASTVEYAKKVGRQTHNFWNEWKKFQIEISQGVQHLEE